ncbi:hypothetical protein BJX76DRAFT_355022 [Aspergillus varians]
MTADGFGRAFGEIKTPWVPRHRLRDAIKGDIESLSRYLTQAADYMKTAGVQYVFISTYNETLFLKQELHNGQGTLLYTRAIEASTQFSANAQGAVPQVTIRECFLHFLSLINEGYAAQIPCLRNPGSCSVMYATPRARSLKGASPADVVRDSISIFFP